MISGQPMKMNPKRSRWEVVLKVWKNPKRSRLHTSCVSVWGMIKLEEGVVWMHFRDRDAQTHMYVFTDHMVPSDPWMKPSRRHTFWPKAPRLLPFETLLLHRTEPSVRTEAVLTAVQLQSQILIEKKNWVSEAGEKCRLTVSPSCGLTLDLHRRSSASTFLLAFSFKAWMEPDRNDSCGCFSFSEHDSYLTIYKNL